MMARYDENEIKEIFAANLTSIMEETNIDGAELARRIGKEKQSVYAWLKKRSFPSAASLQLLVDALDVTTDDLLTKTGGEGDGYVDAPVYGEIAAGVPIEMAEMDSTFPVPMRIRAKYPDSGLVRVEGDSFNRRLPNGCLALIDFSQREPNERDAFAVCVNGYKATIKRVKRLANGYELMPYSYDPTYAPIIYDYNRDDTEEVTIMGKVVWATMPFDYEI